MNKNDFEYSEHICLFCKLSKSKIYICISFFKLLKISIRIYFCIKEVVMRKKLLVSAVLMLILVMLSANLNAGLLKGIGKKKKGPSIGYLLRDDLKTQFKKIWTAYLAEDKKTYLSYFDENVSIASRTLYKKKAKVKKQDLDKKVTTEFKRQDFTKANFEDAFDMDSPNMLFVLSEEQMHDSIPVWRFSISPKEILPYMSKGDYLVIANTLPDIMDKNLTLPSTVYVIFHKQGNKLIAKGIE